jgi:hypothetical protein
MPCGVGEGAGKGGGGSGGGGAPIGGGIAQPGDGGMPGVWTEDPGINIMGIPSLAGGLPCDFGSCSVGVGNSYTGDQGNYYDDGFLKNGMWTLDMTVSWPFLGLPSDPGMTALLQAGHTTHFLTSPLAPVAWYGGATGLAVTAGSFQSGYLWAGANPIAWKCLSDFVGGLLGPTGPVTGGEEQYPCGFWGQAISNIRTVPSH